MSSFHVPNSMCNILGKIWHKTQRTKSASSADELMSTQLHRCLSTLDIILLGIGHMVGSGAYVITSSVAKNVAGPAIVLSYILSGFAAFLCALCYAEFAGRFPKCGSAYSYTYIALGEVWAFIVGWNMILENVIGIAAVSRACSAYLDSSIGGEVANLTNSALTPVLGASVTSHMDLMAGVIAIGFAIFLTLGMKVTTYVNNAFSIINIIAIILIIAIGGYFSDLTNWTNVPGGFMPYGWKGVFAGSASCFYAYIGFDSIATSGEEAKDPQRSIPIATFVAMAMATFSYVSVSAVMTLMVPYNQIADESGLPDALGMHGATWAKLAVIIGACCGMATVLIGTIYSLTRIVYAMSDDGLLFPWMSRVSEKTLIPLQAMFFFTTFGVVLGVFIDITTLVEMMSIGTLIAYLVVSASIIVVRYHIPEKQRTEVSITSVQSGSRFGKDEMHESEAMLESAEEGEVTTGEEEKLLDSTNGGQSSDGQAKSKMNAFYTFKVALGELADKERFLSIINQYCNYSVVSFCVFDIVLFATLFCLTCKLFNKDYVDEKLVVFLLSLITTLIIVSVIIINMHHQYEVKNLRYKVPLVPWIPLLSIFFNVALIVNLNWLTWMRFIVWMAIGFSIYFLYGIKHSKAKQNDEFDSIENNEKRNWGSMSHSKLQEEPENDDDDDVYDETKKKEKEHLSIRTQK